MLTVALPKGRLLGGVVSHLESAGIRVTEPLRAAGRALVVETEQLRLLLLKDADVPTYVDQGAAEVGIVGLDQILESRADVLRLLRLPFGRCRLCLIAPGQAPDLSGRAMLVLASKYPRIAAELAEARSLQVEVIPLAGSVELAARLELADAVLDLVETGRTLRENGLHPVEDWLQVHPYLIANRGAFVLRRDEIRALWRTLGGRR